MNHYGYTVDLPTEQMHFIGYTDETVVRARIAMMRPGIRFQVKAVIAPEIIIREVDEPMEEL